MDVGLGDTAIGDTVTGDTGAEGGDLARYYHRRYRSAHPRDPWESNHGPRYDPYPYRGMRYVAPYVGFRFMTEVDNWRLRGKYYDDYYKNTGKKPRYYNKVTRRKMKW